MGARILAIAIAIAATMASVPTLANQNQERRERDEERNDRGGAEESKTVHAITLADGSAQVSITAVIVMSNTSHVLGVSTRSGLRRVDEDRLDLSGVPLIGGLFGDDEEDDDYGPPRVRIGYAYLVGNSLAVDLSQPVAPGSPHASRLRLADVEDGLKSASVAIETRITEVSSQSTKEIGIDYDLQGQPFELDEFKLLHTNYSYRMPASQFLAIGYAADAAPDATSDETTSGETTSGGTQSAGGKVPVLGDIPLVGNLFTRRAGDAYLEGRSLVVVIKPSILEDEYE